MESPASPREPLVLLVFQTTKNAYSMIIKSVARCGRRRGRGDRKPDLPTSLLVHRLHLSVSPVVCFNPLEPGMRAGSTSSWSAWTPTPACSSSLTRRGGTSWSQR